MLCLISRLKSDKLEIANKSIEYYVIVGRYRLGFIL